MDTEMNENLSIICTHCEKRERPILLVDYSPKLKSYQFMCGESGHGVDDADPIHLHHVLEDDETIRELLTIERAFEAERASVNDPWRITFIEDDF